MDIQLIKRTAEAAAYIGGQILRQYYGKITQIEKKGTIDLVTQADIESEKAIIETIKGKFPDHGFLAEETGHYPGKSGAQWIIDPLDGTTNYAHGIGVFAVSIAFQFNEDVLVGAVLNPISAELFSAVKGQGASLNGKSIQVTQTHSIQESLLATGFPYELSDTDSLMQRLKNGLTASRGIRRMGAAALDLCYVACGRFDGYWEGNLKPWDTAAGSLIANEAGAKTTDFSNNPYHINLKEIVSSNGHIHNELISLLRVKDG